jgi:hypothetical protein
MLLMNKLAVAYLMVKSEWQSEVGMRVEMNHDVTRNRQNLGADAPEDMPEHFIVVLFDKNRGFLCRPQFHWGCHVFSLIFESFSSLNRIYLPKIW